MLMMKYLSLTLIFFSASYIGIIISKKYQNRVKEIKEIKSALNIFINKIKLTYEPIPKIFEEIGNKEKGNINNLFKTASDNMKKLTASEAWKRALNSTNTNLKKEDIEVLKGLGNLLGKIDLEGQVSEIELVDKFLDSQLEKAEEECQKNTKLYKTLGIIAGLIIVIILI